MLFEDLGHDLKVGQLGRLIWIVLEGLLYKATTLHSWTLSEDAHVDIRIEKAKNPKLTTEFRAQNDRNSFTHVHSLSACIFFPSVFFSVFFPL